jgi:RNA polymerase primary sigma factor
LGQTITIPFLGVDIGLEKYLEDIGESKPLSATEEQELARRIKQGDLEARDKLVRANLRFVVSVAKQYQNQGLPLADLINEGNIGLITAAERFDGTKGFKFISYAVWWVRQAILQALAEQSRIVRMPLNRVGLLSKISKVSSFLEQEVGGNPCAEEIAHELEISPEEVMNTLISGRKAWSLDACFEDDDDGRSLLDILGDEKQESPEAAVLNDSLKREISHLLETLDEREAETIRLYFGLGGEEPLTLDQIGMRFGLTRERVRQIKEKALRRLRHPKRSRVLRPYIEDA